MQTTERKNEIAAGIKAAKAKAERITTNTDARQAILTNLQYIDGAASHLFAELDRNERDTEQILSAIRDLCKRADKANEYKEKTPPPDGE